MPPSSVVFVYKGMRYCVYFEDHPVPHFTVETTEGNFRYRLDNLKPLDQSRPKQGTEKKIRKGVTLEDNYQKLWDAWDNNAEPYLPRRN